MITPQEADYIISEYGDQHRRQYDEIMSEGNNSKFVSTVLVSYPDDTYRDSLTVDEIRVIALYGAILYVPDYNQSSQWACWETVTNPDVTPVSDLHTVFYSVRNRCWSLWTCVRGDADGIYRMSNRHVLYTYEDVVAWLSTLNNPTFRPYASCDPAMLRVIYETCDPAMQTFIKDYSS